MSILIHNMDTWVYTIEKLLIFLLATAHLEKQSLAMNLSRFFCYRRPELVASALLGTRLSQARDRAITQFPAALDTSG